ncbi:MAG TPA: DUF167 domain-containing protein [Gaiellaceae bacterium]|nr:DUF167 domain-containing protein [Gaiellaceae bacterium]
MTLTVSPGARRSAIVGRHGDGWKVSVTAPPERGRANEGVLELVADALGVPRRRVRLLKGESSRRKTVEVDGLDDEEAARRLDAAANR